MPKKSRESKKQAKKHEKKHKKHKKKYSDVSILITSYEHIIFIMLPLILRGESVLIYFLVD